MRNLDRRSKLSRALNAIEGELWCGPFLPDSFALFPDQVYFFLSRHVTQTFLDVGSTRIFSSEEIGDDDYEEKKKEDSPTNSGLALSHITELSLFTEDCAENSGSELNSPCRYASCLDRKK